MTLIEKLAKKYAALKSTLTERGRRLWAGTEADAIGRGGVAWVAKATGLAISTVRKGRDEVRAGERPALVRDRLPGAGRPRVEQKDPGLMQALDALVNPTTRGDPESPLRWTCKSVRWLAAELKRQLHEVSPSKVAELLRDLGYSLLANAKTKEGKSHPDRDAQFAFINAKATDFISRGLPVISVDAKKKELVGEHANRGREWQPEGIAVEVLSHDFADPATPQAIPYGVYDVAENAGFVNVGTDHNTPEFAVRSIEKWWEQMGSARYPTATELFITADAGGSNSSRAWLWKLKLQELADRIGLAIHVSHFPPGTSKWNKIEHRLFSFISINWRGHPLTTYETIVQLIAGTRTAKGLRVSADLDTNKYARGIETSKHVKASLRLKRAPFHGEWNYTLHPRSAEEREAASKIKPAAQTVSHPERLKRWLKLFDEQRRSGMSHQKFCAERGIPYDSYIHKKTQLIGPIRPHQHKRSWPQLVREHAASGTTQLEFCRARGINSAYFSLMRTRVLKIKRRPRTAD